MTLSVLTRGESARINLLSDRSPTGVEGSPTSKKEKPHCCEDCGDEPQQHIDQIDPHRVLHPCHARIAFRVLMNVQFAEDAEDGSP